MKKFGNKSTPAHKPQPKKSLSTMGFSPREFNEEESTAKFPTCMSLVEKMLKNRQHTDTKIVVGDDTFNCHMIVLKSYSGYFKKLEKNDDMDKQTIILADDQVTPNAFHVIYEWMLTDNSNLQRPFFAEVFKAAKFLEVTEMISQVISLIDDKKVIGEREALTIYLEAKEANEKSLQKLMMMKISKIFLTFVASWEYLHLSSEEAEQFFQSNRLGVNSELDMMFAAIRWLQHGWPEKKKSVASLMKFVRFELIQSWTLVELKKYSKELEHIFKIREVQSMIDQALSAISLQHSHAEGDDERSPQVFNRLLINDPMWNEFEFEQELNVYQNYCNFCKYLSQLDGSHWRKIKYADPKHESVML